MIRNTAVSAALAILVGCATVSDQQAIETVSGARASIEQAERVDAGTRQADVMASARDKLDAAQRALDAGDEARSIRLAEEARADAAYAVAATRAEQTQAAVSEIEQTLRTLRSETAVQ
jgi:hypothetical protein